VLRAALARAMGALPVTEQEPAIIDTLLAALRSDDWRAQAAAAEALGMRKSAWTVNPLLRSLVELLQDVNSPVRITAYSTLKTISGKDFDGDFAAWKKWVESKEANRKQDN